MKINELSQLKSLVFDGGFDRESRKEVLALEDRLHELVIAENIKQYPTIQKFIEYLSTEAQRCTALLSHDRTLTDLQRQVLFEKRDICQKFTYLFDDTEQQALEESIKSLLDVASSD
jgi:flagellar biosynthesis chaperone FliJ